MLAVKFAVCRNADIKAHSWDEILLLGNAAVKTTYEKVKIMEIFIWNFWLAFHWQLKFHGGGGGNVSISRTGNTRASHALGGLLSKPWSSACVLRILLLNKYPSYLSRYMFSQQYGCAADIRTSWILNWSLLTPEVLLVNVQCPVHPSHFHCRSKVNVSEIARYPGATPTGCESTFISHTYGSSVCPHWNTHKIEHKQNHSGYAAEHFF